MSLILGFDTSGPYCGAALWRDGDVVAARYDNMGRGQAERLFPMLDEVLTEAGVPFEALDAIGVGTGPGNFTGIRISISAARGLALSLGVPAIGVTLFDALAHGTSGDLLLTLAAPRDQLYWQSRIGGAVSDIGQADIRDLPVLPETTTCVGTRSPEVGAALGLPHAPAAYAPASAIARLAAERLGSDCERPAPLYLRPADAAPASDPPPVILS